MDNTNTAEQTFGERLKQARETERYTRLALSKETGIPEKSLEKFEYGSAKPTIDRLYVLADTLGVSVPYLLEGEMPLEDDEIEADTFDNNEADLVNDKCNQVDKFREGGFPIAWRRAPKLIAEIKQELSSYDIDDLLDLAEVRGLFVIEDSEITELSKAKGPVKTKMLFEIIERIVDTLHFGLDLYTLDQEGLEDLAEDLGLDGDVEGLFSSSWSGIPAIAAALRPMCRKEALKGKVTEFNNTEKFKRREVA